MYFQAIDRDEAQATISRLDALRAQLEKALDGEATGAE